MAYQPVGGNPLTGPYTQPHVTTLSYLSSSNGRNSPALSRLVRLNLRKGKLELSDSGGLFSILVGSSGGGGTERAKDSRLPHRALQPTYVCRPLTLQGSKTANDDREEAGRLLVYVEDVLGKETVLFHQVTICLLSEYTC